MHLDPLLTSLSAVALVALVLSIILKRFGQPYIIAYLLSGILLGPHGINIIGSDHTITTLGSMGIVILMFFIGMEVSPKRLAENWKITVFGTLLQILLSIGVVLVLGKFLNWPLNRIILLGFVISLSSTAVVIQLLRDWKELDSKIGQDTLGILLVQDIAIVPMIIILGLLGGDGENHFDLYSLLLQLSGAIFIIAIVVWISKKNKIEWKWLNNIENDREIQVFAALGVCTGFALLTGLLQLSTALGAFVAGLIVSKIHKTTWVTSSLDSLRILFVALFFLSIGILIDLDFLTKHIRAVLLLVAAVLVTNTLITSIILKIFGYNWRSSIYAGSLLSQVGEFSFILATIGLSANIIVGYSYQMTISIITITMFVSPIIIFLVRSFVMQKSSLSPQK